MTETANGVAHAPASERDPVPGPFGSAAVPSQEAGIAAVIFDLDGVLVDSESVWEDVRRELAASHGREWLPEHQERVMGMSTAEWSAYLSHDVGIGMAPSEVASMVVRGVADRYGLQPPMLEGAVGAVRGLARRWPLGLASSSARSLIDLVLERSGLAALFAAVVSTEELARGKPAPDVYLEAAARLGVEPRRCAAVEDSANGLRSAAAAGTWVVAVPNRHYPPDEEALALANVVLESLHQLTPELLESA